MEFALFALVAVGLLALGKKTPTPTDTRSPGKKEADALNKQLLDAAPSQQEIDKAAAETKGWVTFGVSTGVAVTGTVLGIVKASVAGAGVSGATAAQAGSGAAASGSTGAVQAGAGAGAAVGTALGLGASLTVFSFAALLQVAGIIAGPMIWRAVESQEKTIKTRGRPREELYLEALFGMHWAEQNLLRRWLEKLGVTHSWDSGAVSTGLRTFTNIITGDTYQRSFSEGRLSGVSGIGANELRNLATLARFATLEAYWAQNLWNTRCALRWVPSAAWSLSGIGFSDAEWTALEADFVGRHGFYVAENVAAAWYKTGAECKAWTAQNLTDFPALLANLHFTVVVQAVKRNFYRDPELNISWKHSAAAFGYLWVLIAGDVYPWLIAESVGQGIQISHLIEDKTLAWSDMPLLNGRKPWLPALETSFY